MGEVRNEGIQVPRMDGRAHSSGDLGETYDEVGLGHASFTDFLNNRKWEARTKQFGSRAEHWSISITIMKYCGLQF